MSIEYKNGNLLESDCDYICHQVNCMGKMGSGIAKQIKSKWPIVYDNYIKKCEAVKNEGSLLGDIQIVGLWTEFFAEKHHQAVINMFAQWNYGSDNKRYTSYDAFWQCLNLIKYHVPKGRKIGFPYNIGCGLGGANWKIISTMIEEVLSENYEVIIYKLEEK